MAQNSATIVHRCGECLLFNTPKCPWLYSYEIKTKPKEVNSWEEFLKWLYTVENTPNPYTNKLIRNTILPTDHACAYFIPEKR